MSLKIYNLAICGLGRAGSIHTNNCISNSRVKIKYFVDLDVEVAEKKKREFALEKTIVVHADNIDTVLADDELDGVIICTVTHTHEYYVKKCIQAKKAIFCEKPIGENIQDTISCYDSAEKAGVPLFCAFNRRFDATHKGVKEACERGEVGKIHMIKVCSRDSPLPSDAYLKISGGIYHDCAVHDIDMACWLMKEYPISVFSHAHAFRKSIKEMNDVDTVSITMKFESGSIALIDLSRLATYGYDQRVEVFGDAGMVQSLNERKTNIQISNERSINHDLLKFSFPTRYANAYRAELDHFLTVIDGNKPLITKMDVCMVSLIASASEKSYRSGKPINIDVANMTFQEA